MLFVRQLFEHEVPWEGLVLHNMHPSCEGLVPLHVDPVSTQPKLPGICHLKEVHDDGGRDLRPVRVLPRDPLCLAERYTPPPPSAQLCCCAQGLGLASLPWSLPCSLFYFCFWKPSFQIYELLIWNFVRTNSKLWGCRWRRRWRSCSCCIIMML